MTAIIPPIEPEPPVVPDYPVGTPVLLRPTERFHSPQAGYVRAWAPDTPDEVRRTRIPVWLVGDALTDYVAWPNTVMAL